MDSGLLETQKRQCVANTKVHGVLYTFDVILSIISIGGLGHLDITRLGRTCKTLNGIVCGKEMKKRLLKDLPRRFSVLDTPLRDRCIKAMLKRKVMEFTGSEYGIGSERNLELKFVLYGWCSYGISDPKGRPNVQRVTITLTGVYTKSGLWGNIKQLSDKEWEMLLNHYADDVVEHAYVYVARNFTLHLAPGRSVFNDRSGDYVRSINSESYDRKDTPFTNKLALALCHYKTIGTSVQQRRFVPEDYKNVTYGLKFKPSFTSGVELDEYDMIVYTTKIDGLDVPTTFMEIDESSIESIRRGTATTTHSMKLYTHGTTIIDDSYVDHPYFRSVIHNNQ